MNEKLVVIMASDDNYSFLLGSAIYSLFETNQCFNVIDIYIIDDKISNKNKKKLELVAQKYKRNLYFIQAPDLPSEIMVKGTLNISTYYRLAICSLLPEEINKVLYLDCDILIRGALKELWNISVNEYYLAGVQDTTGKYSRLSVGLEKDDVYVNAGVLLINISKLRKMHMEKVFFQYLINKNYEVEFNDQGIINHCCKGYIKIINPKYNYMIPYDRYNRRQLIKIIQKKDFYTLYEIEEAKKNPIIVHFAGYAFSRPWFSCSRGRFIEEFMKISELSGFSFVPKKQPSGIKYKVRKFANSLPDDIAINLNQFIDFVYRVYLNIKE